MTSSGAPVDPAAPEPGAPDDVLLADLDPELAATIDGDSDELIRTPMDRLLLIEGGPGTGKTGTALRRVAQLIADGLEPAEVLVVGPSAAFARLSRTMLDGWGGAGVDHRSIGGLMPAVEAGRQEAPYVTRLKGEARMAGLLSRAVRDRPEPATPELPTSIEIGDRRLILDQATLRRVVTMARASEAPPDDRRRILRGALAASSEDPRLVLAAADLLAERLWPAFTPSGFLRDLFAAPEWLAAAAGGEFTEREISALLRDPVDPWFSDADLALLDETEQLVDGNPRQYAHVLLDEAHDLSPMQLRAVARRSATGSMTVVGDLAQSTGLWARDDWHDVLAHLPTGKTHEHRELRYGFRVPRQIFDLAAELLPAAAPSVQPPTVVRQGPSDPVIVPVTAAERAEVVAKAAAEHLAENRSVVVICPAPCRPEVEACLDEQGIPWQPEPGEGVSLLGPRDVKGLEFDAAVVVEPGLIVDDDPRGHRLLYVALTRATGYLHLVGLAEDLPVEFAAPPIPAPSSVQAPPVEEQPVEEPPAAEPAVVVEPEPEPEEPEPEPEPEPAIVLDPYTQERIEMVANALAETLITNLTPDLWPIALDRLAHMMKPLEMPDY
ncbi:MAG: ATP-binding domain-containing protein [Actinoplanes sp.]